MLEAVPDEEETDSPREEAPSAAPDEWEGCRGVGV